MGKSIRHGRPGALALAAVLGWFGGCQSPSVPAGHALLVPAAEDSLTRPTDRQAADVQVAFGRSCEARGDTERALAAYAEAVKRDPRRTDAYVRLAVLHDLQGKFRESAELYRKALQSSPGNPEVFCDMGYSLYLQRRWAEAEMNLQQALTLKPDLARAHNNLGLVMAHTDRLDQALAHFRKAGPEAEAHLNLALALTMDRRWDEARAQYERALAANPALEQAKMGLRQLDALAAAPVSAKAPDDPPPGSVARIALTAPISEPASEVAKAVPAPDPMPPVAETTRVAKVGLEYLPIGASGAPAEAPPVSAEPVAAVSAAEESAGDGVTTSTLALTFFRIPVNAP